MKEAENNAERIEWGAKWFLSKNNYLIPSGNYKENLEWLAYAEEADILNVALFGFTAKAWRNENPELAKKPVFLASGRSLRGDKAGIRAGWKIEKGVN